MILAQDIVLAHAGEESLYVLGPLVIIVALIMLASKRREEKEDEEEKGRDRKRGR